MATTKSRTSAKKKATAAATQKSLETMDDNRVPELDAVIVAYKNAKFRKAKAHTDMTGEFDAIGDMMTKQELTKYSHDGLLFEATQGKVKMKVSKIPRKAAEAK